MKTENDCTALAGYSDLLFPTSCAGQTQCENINAEINVIFQSIENLHKACTKNAGDWYFTGNYPTTGGTKVVNRAFINFYEGISKRAY